MEVPRPPSEKDPDVSHSISGCASCTPSCSVFAINGIHVIAVRAVGGIVVLDVETDRRLTGCPRCGVLADWQGRRVHEVADAPAFGRPVRVRWSKWFWRCAESACPTWTFSEAHPIAPARAKLTARAAAWAVGMLRTDDTTVAALARRLRVGWHTLWRAIQQHAAGPIDDPARLGGVVSLGVDDHIWKPSRRGADRAVMET